MTLHSGISPQTSCSHDRPGGENKLIPSVECSLASYISLLLHEISGICFYLMRKYSHSTNNAECWGVTRNSQVTITVYTGHDDSVPTPSGSTFNKLPCGPLGSNHPDHIVPEQRVLAEMTGGIFIKSSRGISTTVLSPEVSTAFGKRMPRPSPWDKHGRHQAQHGDNQDDPRLSVNISIFHFQR
ncbi:hypothetical protein GH733_009764 [Mirounga leonina]|nr:hypothetical protein GH733_009764 [Mirounga leonina]